MDEDNLYATLKPVNYLCRIFGVASYSISDIKNDCSKLGKRFWQIIWPFILVVLLICGYIYRIRYTFIVESNLVHHSFLVPDILNTSTEYVACIVLIILRTAYHPKNMSLILKKFGSLNFCVFGCRDGFNTQKGISPVIRASFWLLTCTKVLVKCCNLVLWKTHWTPVLILGENWCNCALSVIVLKYVILVHYYMSKHRELNYQITVLNDTMSPKINVLVSKNVKELLSVGSSSNPRPNQISEATACTTVSHRDTVSLKRVIALKEAHMHLYDVAQLLNSAYGFQLLLCLAFVFFQLLLTYNMAIDLVVTVLSRKAGMASDIQEWSCFCLAVLSSVMLMFVTVSCHLASEEANKTGHLVHTLLLKPDLASDLILQLQLFSSQVSNLTVRFTTCGFFTINASLFCGIAGVVCTYLIILHQFR
jgi:7tm Chemosensory receptor.